eukprot:3206771-Rhodomonas_salina.1
MQLHTNPVHFAQFVLGMRFLFFDAARMSASAMCEIKCNSAQSLWSLYQQRENAFDLAVRRLVYAGHVRTEVVELSQVRQTETQRHRDRH